MELERVNFGHATLFRVIGVIDEQSLLDLRLAITDQLKRKQANIVLNLKKVEMMDQVSAGYLLELLQMTRKKGGDIKLVSPTLFVEQLFYSLGIWRLFDVFSSESEAVDSFRLVA